MERLNCGFICTVKFKSFIHNLVMTKLTSSKALKFKTHTFIAQYRKSNKTIEKYNSYFFARSDTHNEYTDFKRGKYKEDSSTLAFWTSNQFSKP